jgi:hypothetical protein
MSKTLSRDGSHAILRIRMYQQTPRGGLAKDFRRPSRLVPNVPGTHQEACIRIELLIAGTWLGVVRLFQVMQGFTDDYFPLWDPIDRTTHSDLPREIVLVEDEPIYSPFHPSFPDISQIDTSYTFLPAY